MPESVVVRLRAQQRVAVERAPADAPRRRSGRCGGPGVSMHLAALQNAAIPLQRTLVRCSMSRSRSSIIASRRASATWPLTTDSPHFSASSSASEICAASSISGDIRWERTVLRVFSNVACTASKPMKANAHATPIPTMISFFISNSFRSWKQGRDDPVAAKPSRLPLDTAGAARGRRAAKGENRDGSRRARARLQPAAAARPGASSSANGAERATVVGDGRGVGRRDSLAGSGRHERGPQRDRSASTTSTRSGAVVAPPRRRGGGGRNARSRSSVVRGRCTRVGCTAGSKLDPQPTVHARRAPLGQHGCGRTRCIAHGG